MCQYFFNKQRKRKKGCCYRDFPLDTKFLSRLHPRSQFSIDNIQDENCQATSNPFHGSVVQTAKKLFMLHQRQQSLLNVQSIRFCFVLCTWTKWSWNESVNRMELSSWSIGNQPFFKESNSKHISDPFTVAQNASFSDIFSENG